MGLSLLVDEAYRLPQLNAVVVPAGVDEASVRAQLLNRNGIEIGAGLGALAGKVWRIGLMGHASNTGNILHCLAALESALILQGFALDRGAAVAAASAMLD